MRAVNTSDRLSLAACYEYATSRGAFYWLLLSALMLTAKPSLAGTEVNIDTSEGLIVVELYDKQAPISTRNFLAYVRSGFYNNTVFHRVIPSFMIQGGGYNKSYRRMKVKDPISNEAANGLKNKRGSLAMARSQEKDSATSQFFINLVDNAFLDHNARDHGYAVFGQVIKGMRVVDSIGNKPTTTHRGLANVPKEPIFIIRAWVEGEDKSPQQEEAKDK